MADSYILKYIQPKDESLDFQICVYENMSARHFTIFCRKAHFNCNILVDSFTIAMGIVARIKQGEQVTNIIENVLDEKIAKMLIYNIVVFTEVGQMVRILNTHSRMNETDILFSEGISPDTHKYITSKDTQTMFRAFDMLYRDGNFDRAEAYVKESTPYE